MNNFFRRKLKYRFLVKEKNNRMTVKKVIDDKYASELSIDCPGLPALNSVNLKIYNPNIESMLDLSFLQYRKTSNAVLECIYEQDEQDKIIFRGDIINSIPIYDIPNPYLNITAMTDYNSLIKPSKDIIYEIPDSMYYIEVPIRDIIDKILEVDPKTKKINYDNRCISYYGVDNFKIVNPRLQGSKIIQLDKVRTEARLKSSGKRQINETEANINIIINFDSIIISPVETPSYKDTYQIDCKENRIINQISNDRCGISFSILYDPNINLGKKIKIINDELNPLANGNFIVYDVKHSLSCNMLNGEFFTKVKAKYMED